MLSRPSRISRAIAMAPKASIMGEFNANAAADRRLALNSRRAASRKRRISHISMQKAVDLGQLVLTFACGDTNLVPDSSRRGDDEGNEDQQHPAQSPAQAEDRDTYENEGEELLQELGQHARHGELH